MAITRYLNLDAARQRFGTHVDKLRPFFDQGDPLGDAVVEAFTRLPPGKGRELLLAALDNGIAAVPEAPDALRKLFAQLEDVPFWVDWDHLNLAGTTNMRCGVRGGLILACCALPLIYSSPAGNKPLIFSGKLVERAARRLQETARFVVESCQPNGLRPFANGWKITVKVRLMHAQMRLLLRRSGRWDDRAWGAQINQVDMAYTNLLFSMGLMHNLRRVGFHFTRAESEGVMHLWRYSGYLLGIEPELLCATEAEGRRLADLIEVTQGPPDFDSQALTKALMEKAIPHLVLNGEPDGEKRQPRLTSICYGLSHNLLGRLLAEQLNYPKTHWRHVVRLIARVRIMPVELCRLLVPGVHGWLIESGKQKILERLDYKEKPPRE